MPSLLMLNTTRWMSITEHSRQFLVKQGQQSAIASFNLYPRNSDDIDADIKTMDNVS
ncbi:Uncharacterised protein [Escherichia coli]|nr:Uncharacterised protein [Escherichia coli]